MLGKVLDWKFALSTALAIVAIALPAYFWQADLSPYSLTVRLASSSALELPADSKIHDLQIVVNGAKIESPHIYSLVLINTGSKPIPTGSFETPVQVRTLNDAKLITAQITGSEPADIPVKISIDDNQLKILPFLSNPKDQVTITLVSSGSLELKAQGRIAGVRDIVFEDISNDQSRPLTAFFFAAISVPCLGLYLFFLPTSNSSRTIKIGMTVRVLSTLVFFMSGVHFVSRASEELAYSGASSFAIMLPLFIIGAILMLFLERRSKTLNASS